MRLGLRGALRVIALAAAAVALGGCAQLGYYWHSTTGHLALLNAARPVDTVLAQPDLAPGLRQRLELSQRLRDYAVRALALPDNASYRRYADLGRPAAVWNVIAAPELSLTLQTWCFPVVGCVGYRGYYDEALARTEADALRAQGLETYVYGVPAYSTLGKLPGAWFADPLLNTFVTTFSELELARLIFHELSHQVAYAAGDTTFNESYATAVERLGSTQWLATEVDPEVRTRVLAQAAAAEARRDDFRRIAMGLRERLQALYASPLADAEKRRAKATLIDAARAEHAALKSGAGAGNGAGNGAENGASAWSGYTGYDAWFAGLNNAQLGVLAAYQAQVADFERLFERQGRDWPRFHAEVRRLAELPAAERVHELARP